MIELETGIMCRSAYASNKKYDWILSIRKKDDAEVGDIARKHKESVDSKYLRDYLPGWDVVEWKKLNTPPLFPQDLMAECGEYKLNIILAEKCTKDVSQIVDEFREFMSA